MKKTSPKSPKKVAKKNIETKGTLTKEPYISSYQTSEGIVKLILDKIINISIHQSNMNKINSQINDYCFEYIQAQIEPLFEENFINYTKLKNDQKTLFWKTKKPPENQWIEIFEPETVENDRFESCGVNIQEIKNKKEAINEINEGIEHNENNEKDKENTTKKNQNKDKQVKINILKNKSRKDVPIIIDDNKKENNNTNSKNSQTQKSIEKTNVNQNIRSKTKKVPLLDFPFDDIPGIEKEFKHEIYDPPNIHMLRKDIEEEIKNKEKESNINSNANKIIKKKEDLEKFNKNVKPLDSNKFTFDSNGKIISFKAYKLDNLSKDFNFSRNAVKEKAEKEEIQNKPKRKSRLSIKEQNEIVVIKDNKMQDYIHPEEKKEKVKDKIIPSGSNFRLILPNIGVVIKENNNKKEGSRDFNKYFKKYSTSDYDKILNEYVPLQNKSKIKDKLERMNLTSTIIQKQLSESIDRGKNNTVNNSQLNISTTNNKKAESTYLMNPLLSSNDNIPIADNNNTYINQNSSYIKTSENNSFNKCNILYNPLMTSFNMRSGNVNFSQDKKGNIFSNSIIMKKLGAGSLKMEIDCLQELKSEPNYRKLKSFKKENIFGKKWIKTNRLNLIINSKDNPLYAFNKKILTDANFGNITDLKHKEEKENIVISRHLSKQEAFKELGNTMINGIKIKFPRSRKVELSK